MLSSSSRIIILILSSSNSIAQTTSQEPWEKYLVDVVLVWYKISHYEAELRCGEEAAQLVIIRAPPQPVLDYELVSAILPGDEPVPAHPDTGESDLLHPGGTSEPGVGSQGGAVTLHAGHPHCHRHHQEEEEGGHLVCGVRGERLDGRDQERK